MIRFILICIFIFLFLLFSLILQPIMLLIGVFSPKARDKACIAIVSWAFRFCIKLAGTKQTIIGEENVPKDEAVMYVLNHRSFFDVILTYPRVPRPTGYVAKKELSHYLTFTWWMQLLHCELLDRSDLRKGMQSMNHCADLIKKGISVAIFPEGTRNKGEEPLLDFHKGSFKIAEKSNCKIIPVVLNNTSAIFEDHLPRVCKKHVVIEYLPAIDVAALDREERKALPELVRSQMSQVYVKNKELV